MTMTANLHHISDMKAHRADDGSCAWLTMSDLRNNRVSVFMPYDMASEIADLWKHMNREPEPQTWDEALAMKCDADARMDEARKLKGMI